MRIARMHGDRYDQASKRAGSRRSKVLPDGQQRLLDYILGDIEVAQDPVGHRVKTAPSGPDAAREGPFVTMLAAITSSVSMSSAVASPWWGRVTRYSTCRPSGDSMFLDTRRHRRIGLGAPRSSRERAPGAATDDVSRTAPRRPGLTLTTHRVRDAAPVPVMSIR